VQDAATQADNALQKIDKTTAAVNAQFDKLSRQNELGGIVDEFKGAVSEAKSLDGVLAKVSKRLNEIGATEGEIAGVVNQLERARSGGAGINQGEVARQGVGDVSTSFGAAASVLNAGGTGAAGEASALVGDIAGFVEYIPLFRKGIADIGNQLLSSGSLTQAAVGKFGKLPVAVASIGAGVIATIALGVAVDQYNKIVAASAQATKNFIGAQEQYYTLLVTGTTKEVQEAVKLREQERAIAEARLAETRNFIAQANAAIDNADLFTNVFANASVALGANLGGIKDLETLEQELTKQSGEADTAITRLNQGLEANAFAANDAAAAEEELAKKREAFTDRLLTTQINTLISAASQSSDAVNDRLQAIADEKAVLQDFIATGQLSAEKTEELRTRIQDLSVEESTLAQQVIPLIEAREAETEAIKSQLDAIDSSIQSQIQLANLLENATPEQIRDRQRAIDIEREAIEAQLDELKALADQSEEGQAKLEQYENRLAALNDEASNLDLATPAAQMRALADNAEQVAKATQSLNTDLAKLASTRDSRLTELASKLEDGLAEIGTEFFDQQAKQRAGDLEELAKFNQEEQDRVKAHRQTLEQIQRQFDRAQGSAIQDRNAVALQSAIDSRDDSVDTETEKFNAESEKRRRDIEDLKKTQSQERQELFSSYQKKYNALIEQNRREVQATQIKYQQDVATRQAAFAQQQSQLQTALNQELNIRTNAFSTMLNQASTFAGKLIQIANGLNTTGAQQQQRQIITPTTVYQPNYTPSRAVGGYTSPNMLTRINEQGTESGVNDRGDFAIFSRPTTVFTAKQTAGMGGLNIPISISGMGMTQTQIRREVDQRLSKTLSEAGISA
jgi:hypothetical protein